MAEQGESVAEIEQQLRAGEWLSAGPVAAVLGVSRATVSVWLTEGHTAGPDPLPLRHSLKGSHRRCHPADVLAILERHREVRGG